MTPIVSSAGRRRRRWHLFLPTRTLSAIIQTLATGMLTIRQEQLAVFWQLEPRRRAFIRCGIGRAAGYRITARRDVCKYTTRASAGQRMRDLIEAGQKHLRES
jgi:hypothetical protein